MTLKCFFLIAKIALRLGALPPEYRDFGALYQFAQHAAQIATFFEQNHLNFWFKPLSKILVAAVKF